MPVLNLLCAKLELKQAKISLLVILVVFSGYATSIRPVGDIFALCGGFSFLWFCILYSIGALIKKYNVFVCENVKLLKSIIVNLGITWFSVCFLGGMTKVIVGQEIGESFLIEYNSPTVLIASICIMILFLKMKIKRGENQLDIGRRLHLRFMLYICIQRLKKYFYSITLFLLKMFLFGSSHCS